jgi:L-fuculokinase
MTLTIAIFDIGKTNKKAFLFDENYQIVWQKSVNLPETIDEDGDPCEDIDLLTNWVLSTFDEIVSLPNFDVKAVNFSTYGASFVYLDEDGKPLTSLYNYLKDYSKDLKKQFYDTYGGEEDFAVKTASPILGSLNSGMQIYRLKYEQPEVFEKVKYCLHLPQYLSFLLSGQAFSDITSIGCHTNLWNFQKNQYHEWVERENIIEKLVPIITNKDKHSSFIIHHSSFIGIGLHDSSSALIPYLINFTEPFILLSTGTWSISLNPFNDTPLTFEELQQDCLCYLTYKGNPVKAARLFAGNEHEIQIKRIASYFGLSNDFYKQVEYNKHIISQLDEKTSSTQFDLTSFENADNAYHQMMIALVNQQTVSTKLVIQNSPVKKIFVDGGFSKNHIFMILLAKAFPETEVYAASMAQASALGAALAIHKHWHSKPMPNDLIELRLYKN